MRQILDLESVSCARSVMVRGIRHKSEGDMFNIAELGLPLRDEGAGERSLAAALLHG
jgi:hypothetical protein